MNRILPASGLTVKWHAANRITVRAERYRPGSETKAWMGSTWFYRVRDCHLGIALDTGTYSHARPREGLERISQDGSLAPSCQQNGADLDQHNTQQCTNQQIGNPPSHSRRWSVAPSLAGSGSAAPYTQGSAVYTPVIISAPCCSHSTGGWGFLSQSVCRGGVRKPVCHAPR